MVHLTSKSSFKGKMMMMLMHIPGHTCDAEDQKFRPLPPSLHGPVLMFLCPLLVLLMMDSGQKGTWPVCTYAVPYTANYDALVSVRTYMNLFGSLSYVNPSVESAHTGQPLFPACISELGHLWPCRWFITVSTLDHFWWILISAKMVWPSRHHNLAPVKLTQILILAHCSCF